MRTILELCYLYIVGQLAFQCHTAEEDTWALVVVALGAVGWRKMFFKVIKRYKRPPRRSTLPRTNLRVQMPKTKPPKPSGPAPTPPGGLN